MPCHVVACRWHVPQHAFQAPGFAAQKKLTIIRCFAQAAAQAAERRARDDATCPSGPLGTQRVGYNDASAEVVVLDSSLAAPRQPSASRAEVGVWISVAPVVCLCFSQAWNVILTAAQTVSLLVK